MEPREWYEQALQQAEERGFERGLEIGLRQTMMARLYGIRLGRSLTEVEQAALASLLDRLGEDRVCKVLLSFSVEALATWLGDPHAQ